MTGKLHMDFQLCMVGGPNSYVVEESTILTPK